MPKLTVFDQDCFLEDKKKIQLSEDFKSFLNNDLVKEKSFSNSLSKQERLFLHKLAEEHDLEHKSFGYGCNRHLCISKKSAQTGVLDNIIPSKAITKKLEQLTYLYPFENCPIGFFNAKYRPGNLDNKHSSTFSVQCPPQPTISSYFREIKDALPVTFYRERVLDLLEENQTILVVGETGSGKTTQIPQFILEDCNKKGKKCLVYCTQPRRIATIAAAERVSTERGEDVGTNVGYMIRLEKKVDTSCNLVFCTAGVLLNLILNRKSLMANATHIIVDEVHERDRFTDFLLIILRDSIKSHFNFKVLLMSATINYKLFSDYFSHCPVISIPGRLYPVQQLFLEDILLFIGYDSSNTSNHKAFNSDDKDDADEAEIESDDEDDIIILSESIDYDEAIDPFDMMSVDELYSRAFNQNDFDCFAQIIERIGQKTLDVNYVHEETGLSIMMIAASRGKYDLVEYLLQSGADRNIAANNGWTAIDFALHLDRNDIVGLFLKPRSKAIDVLSSIEHVAKAREEVLSSYHNTFDDDNIDFSLICRLIRKIVETYKDGSILVFLPGFSEILATKDLIDDDDVLSDRNKFEVFLLHSSMQTKDQKRIYEKLPLGVRKLILSTNIAESSITINDVVFVIDSGKVKEKVVDNFTTASYLRTEWISQASTMQRMGRAGRTRPGACFHLFSRTRFESFSKFPTAEILRSSLSDICLQVKTFVGSSGSIYEFLMRAPEAPPKAAVKSAIFHLKAINALDCDEKITELGAVLSRLPLEPHLGKMVLYGISLRCLDPIVVIAAIMSDRQLSVISVDSANLNVPFQKNRFAAGMLSDHLMAFNQFTEWLSLHSQNPYEAINFCKNYNLSQQVMESILKTRSYILRTLRDMDFIDDFSTLSTLNSYAGNSGIIRAVLTVGLYPFIANRSSFNKYFSRKQKKVLVHGSSVLKNFDSPNFTWIAFDELKRTKGRSYIFSATAILSAALLLLCGGQELPTKTTSSHAIVSVDEWISFKMENEVYLMLMDVRARIFQIVDAVIRRDSFSPSFEASLEILADILQTMEPPINLKLDSYIDLYALSSDLFSSSSVSHKKNQQTRHRVRRAYNVPKQSNYSEQFKYEASQEPAVSRSYSKHSYYPAQFNIPREFVPSRFSQRQLSYVDQLQFNHSYAFVPSRPQSKKKSNSIR